MFDGVHRGHQAVIRQAISAAREEGHVSGVLTFDPHPSHVLHPQRATAMLMPLGQRVQHMMMLGLDYVFVQPFTVRYAGREARDFVAALKELFPSLVSIHVGENFRFGAGRSGDIATLGQTAAAAGVELHALPREHLDGDTISSSRIREAIAKGDMVVAAEMLGGPYLVEGRVVAGKGIGRRMDYPTLNIPWNPQARPRFGVYRVLLRSEGSGSASTGVANYGVRPTVEKTGDPVVEVHLIDPGEIPGRGDTVRVALLEFIRDEAAFGSIEALREQIGRDAGRVRNWRESTGSSELPVF
jgi:riboflavin kinase/FMN adenylyltransferase